MGWGDNIASNGFGALSEIGDAIDRWGKKIEDKWAQKAKEQEERDAEREQERRDLHAQRERERQEQREEEDAAHFMDVDGEDDGFLFYRR